MADAKITISASDLTQGVFQAVSAAMGQTAQTAQDTSDQARAAFDALFAGVQDGAASVPDALAQVAAASDETAGQVSSTWRDTWAGFAGGAAEAISGLGESLGETLKGAIEDPIGSVKGVLTGAIDAMGPFGVGLAAVGAAAGAAGEVLMSLAEHSNAVGAALERASLATGIGVPAMSSLKFAIESVGGSFDTINNSMFMFQQRLENSTDKVNDGLKMIGLSMADIKDLQPDQQFLAISNAFRTSGDDVNRAAAAMDIFGRSGKTLLPDLMQNLSGLVDTSKQLGDTWSTEDAEAAHEFEVASKTMATETAASWDELGKAIAPITNDIVLAYDRMKLAFVNVLVAVTDAVSGFGWFHAAWNTFMNDVGKLPEVNSNIRGLIDGSGLAAKGLKNWTEGISARAAAAPSLDAALAAESEATADINDKLAKQAEARKKAAAETEKWQQNEAAIALQTLDLRDKLDRLDDSTEQAIEWDVKHGASVDQVATRYNVLKPLVQAVKEQVDFLTVSTKNASDALHSHYSAVGLLAPAYSAVHGELTGLNADGTVFSEDVNTLGDNLKNLSLKAIPVVHDGVQSYIDDLRNASTVTGLFGDEVDGQLRSISRSFEKLANIAGGSFAGVMKDVGTLVGQLSLLDNASQQVQGGIEQMSTDATGGAVNVATGMMSMGSSAVGAFEEIQKGGAKATAMGIASMTETGAAIGSVIPGIGTAVGAGVGLVVGAMSALFKDKTPRDIARNAGHQFGQEWSDGLQQTIVDSAKKLHDEVAGELINLPAIIKEHPIDASNLVMYTGKFHDLFSMIETHKLSVKDVASTLDQSFGQLAQAATEADGRISDGLKQIIDLNQRFGTDSRAIAQFLQGQASNAITDFNTVVQNLDGTVDKTGQSLDDMGVQAVTAFASAVAAGTSTNAALKQIAPSLTQLQAEYKTLGLDTDNVALKNLEMQSTVLQGNPKLMDAIGGLSSEMVALDNMGTLNTDTLAAMERTGYAAFSQLKTSVDGLVSQGLVPLDDAQKQTLLPMQDYLHEAQKEAAALKAPLDDNTQSLIDQSKELGIWKDAGESSTDKLVDGMTTLVDKVSQLIDRLSGVQDTSASSLGTLTGQLQNAATVTDDVTNRMKLDWKGVEDGINAVNFGHSPGGIKEIPIQLTNAVDAMRAFAVKSGLNGGALQTVFDGINHLSAAIGAGDGQSVVGTLDQASVALGVFSTSAGQNLPQVKLLMDQLYQASEAVKQSMGGIGSGTSHDPSGPPPTTIDTGGKGIPIPPPFAAGTSHDPSGPPPADMLDAAAVHSLAVAAFRGYFGRDPTDAELGQMASAVGYTQGSSLTRAQANALMGRLQTAAAARFGNLSNDTRNIGIAPDGPRAGVSSDPMGVGLARSFANEAYDLARPVRAIVGDAPGDPESVLRQSTVRQLVASARASGAQSVAVSMAGVEKRLDTLTQTMKSLMMTQPALLRHALRGA